MGPKKRDGLKVHGAGSARERQRAPCPPVCAKSARLRSLACALLQLAGYLCDTMKDGTDVEVYSQNELIAHAQPTSGDQSFGWGWRITKSNNRSNNNKKKIYNRPDFEIYTDENWVRTPGSAAWLSAGQRGVEIAKRQAMI